MKESSPHSHSGIQISSPRDSAFLLVLGDLNCPLSENQEVEGPRQNIEGRGKFHEPGLEVAYISSAHTPLTRTQFLGPTKFPEAGNMV